jgi:hypothetical protein
MSRSLRRRPLRPALAVSAALLAALAGALLAGMTAADDSCPAAADSRAAGPAYLASGDIAAIRAAVAAGREPWVSSHRALMADARAALLLPVQSVVAQGDPGHAYRTQRPFCGWTAVDGHRPDCRDGMENPEADRGDYRAAIAAGRAARTLALAWLLSGDEHDAARAVQLLEGWTIAPATAMEPHLTDAQSHIELYVTMPGLIYAADLLSGYRGWPAGRQAAVRDWFHRLAADADRLRHRNNFEDWRSLLVLASARLDRDGCRFDRAVEHVKALVAEQISPDGFMTAELQRTDSLSYSLFALNALVQAAELAARQGTDLYHYRAPTGSSLAQALLRHAPFAAGAPGWPYRQLSPLSAAGDSIALFEPAYRALGDPSLLAVLEHWGRPIEETRVLGPVTLTHSLSPRAADSLRAAQ